MVTMRIDVTGTYIIEPGIGDTTTVDICLTASINGSLSRDATFVWKIDVDGSNATHNSDYKNILPSLELTIPSGTSKSYISCFNGSVLGDNFVEGNEVIIATLTPQSDQDRVEYPGGLDSLILVIVDNSSM